MHWIWSCKSWFCSSGGRAPPSLDQIPPAPVHAVMDFYQGYLWLPATFRSPPPLSSRLEAIAIRNKENKKRPVYYCLPCISCTEEAARSRKTRATSREGAKGNRFLDALYECRFKSLLQIFQKQDDKRHKEKNKGLREKRQDKHRETGQKGRTQQVLCTSLLPFLQLVSNRARTIHGIASRLEAIASGLESVLVSGVGAHQAALPRYEGHLPRFSQRKHTHSLSLYTILFIIYCNYIYIHCLFSFALSCLCCPGERLK